MKSQNKGNLADKLLLLCGPPKDGLSDRNRRRLPAWYREREVLVRTIISSDDDKRAFRNTPLLLAGENVCCAHSHSCFPGRELTPYSEHALHICR